MTNFEKPEIFTSASGVAVTPAPPLLAYSAPGQVPADWLPTLSEHHIDLSRAGGLIGLIKLRIALRLAFSMIMTAVLFYLWTKPGMFIAMPVLLFILIIILVTTIIRMIRIWNHEMNTIRSLVIHVSDLGIMRKAQNVPELMIFREQVTKVTVLKRGLIVRTKKNPVYIFVPNALDNFESLKSRLAVWKAIEPVRHQALRIAVRLALAALMLGAMVTLISSRTAAVAVPAGIVVELLLTWNVIVFWRSPHLSQRRKIVLILSMAFMGLAIGFNVMLRIPAISPFGPLPPRIPSPVSPVPAPTL